MLRSLASVLVALLLGCATAHAQAPEFVFAVTEGVTYQATPKDIRDRFAPLAEALSRVLHRNVHIVLVPAYDDLRAGLARQEYDLAFVHPAHVALAEIKSGRYQSLAWTAGFTDYSVFLLAPATDATATASLKGRTLVTPDPDSITAVMVRAMFRDQKLTDRDVKVVTTRYQDAVPFYLEHGFAQVGATAAKGVVKAWTDKGGKVIGQSRPVPVKQIIVSTRVPSAEQERLREALVGLADSKPGRAVLGTLGYRGFVVPSLEVQNASIAWLGL